MAARRAASAWTGSGATLCTFVLVEVLRIWFAGLSATLAPTWMSPATALLVIVVATLAVGPLTVMRPHGGPRTRFQVGVLLLAVGRTALLVVDAGIPLVVASTVAVAGGSVAICGLAAGARDTVAARVGMLLGLTSAVVVHTALSTLDLVWRTSLVATLASALLVAALLVTAIRIRSGIAGADALGGAAWPWATFGPALLLIGAISGVPGRVAVATGWSDAAVATVVVVSHGAAVLAAVLGRRLGIAAGPAGAALVLIGTAGALEPDGPLAVVAQAALVVGVGLVLGASTRTVGTATSRRRGLVVGLSLVGFGIVTVLYYGAYGAPFGLNNRVLLLVAAFVHASIGIAAGRQARRRPVTTVVEVRTGAVAVAVVAVAAAVVAISVAPTTTTVPTPASQEEPVRVALHNVTSGFAPDGRFTVLEIADTLRSLSPDVVVLTEVDRGWLVNGGHDTLRLLADGTGLPFVFAPAADEIHGHALLTRYPVAELSVERLPSGGDRRARSVFAAVLDVTTDQQLAIVGTQLAGPEVSLDRRLPQARSVAAMVARMRERGLPTAVLGNLTTDPDGPELATFEPLVSSVLGSRLTYPADDPQLQADQVLISSDLRATDLAVPEQAVSGHRPVAVTLHRIRTDPPS